MSKTMNMDNYEIRQADNYDVMILKDNRRVFHAQCDKPKSEDELRQMFRDYMNFMISTTMK